MNKITKIKRIYILSFIFAFHIALSSYINSTFLTNFFSEDYVGLLYTIGSIITLILLSTSSTILKHFGNRRFVLGLLLINMLALAGLITSGNSFIVGLSFISFITTNTLVLLCIDIFIEHFGDIKVIGKIRGFYLTIINLAWLISPLITGLLITKEGGYKTIYLIAFAAVVLMTVGLFLSIKTFKDKKYERTPFFKAYKLLKQNHHIWAITMISFILRFFYSVMTIYTPIYLYKHIGFGWDQIGVIFTIMLIPFIILGLPIGFFIDKYNISKKYLLSIGIIIMSLSTLVISTISDKNIALWALIMFMTRIGASIIETTSEIYFFTHIKEEEAYLLGMFRDMGPISTIIAPIVATIILLFVPFKFIFVALGILILFGFYYIPKLKNKNEIPISS